jgi:hypothetical protein
MSLKEEVLQYVDLKGLVVDLAVKKYAKTALENVVKSTDNTFDDAAFAMLWPLLEKEVERLAAEGLAKLTE